MDWIFWDWIYWDWIFWDWIVFGTELSWTELTRTELSGLKCLGLNFLGLNFMGLNFLGLIFPGLQFSRTELFLDGIAPGLNCLGLNWRGLNCHGLNRWDWTGPESKKILITLNLQRNVIISGIGLWNLSILFGLSNTALSFYNLNYFISEKIAVMTVLFYVSFAQR